MTEAFADAVIVAAGSSRRMGGVDKLAADLGGQPLVAWAVDAMAGATSVRRIIFVAPPAMVEALGQLDCLRRNHATIVAGGETRSRSVLAGVSAADGEVVVVHDGARPLVSASLVDAVAVAAARHGAAVPVVPVHDSLRQVSGDRIVGAVDRDGLVAAQTPQGARRDLLLAAFAAADGADFTDEAGLLQAHGIAVVTVPGEATNIKVTQPADLELARAIAAGRNAATAAARTGFGVDSHQFGRLDGLWLAGVLIADAPRLHGHSDGDVALHALATALLSATGQGDLGRLFPAGEQATAGAPSAGMVRRAVASTAASGWMPATARVSLVGARPRLGAARLESMRAVLAEILDLAVDDVSVTASSGNLSGAEGSGRAISATALVTVTRA